ncbi:MAG TPA: LacI family DNA-binding transcriptional regulator [Segeticoccus sp.]|jgi:DNA-binding LacI/PurR family transcriptional regulator|nr:LacI family DNA-binding transcriptional regulator [Segeticoccus sp.]
MTARLADVARYAQVSEATVSRVLNDKPGVAPATRQAVLTALDVLGYDRPSRLRPQGGGSIGLVLPELTTPVFPALAQVVETGLAAVGYACVLCTVTAGGVHEEEYVRMLRDRGVAGIVFVSGGHADLTCPTDVYADLLADGLPVVFVNGFREGLDAPFISTDEEAAVRQAVGHLHDLGHQRIGLAAGQARFVPTVRKVEAYRAVMADLLGEHDVDELVAHTYVTVEGGATAGRVLLGRGVTAVVAASDSMALGVVRAARHLGRAVPSDLSVIGRDDSPLLPFTDPPLTTLRQDVTGMGQAVVSAMLDRISGRERTTGEFLFSPELVVRGSTAAAPR